MPKVNNLSHPFDAIYNHDSKILILGSFPSVKSREESFYYAHPQNRFWKVLSIIYKEQIPNDIVSKKAFLYKHNIALYDVCLSCTITNSSDASIKEVVPTDITSIINNSNIKVIFLNGNTAYKLFIKYHKDIDMPVIALPSTSPANAKFSIDELVRKYQVMLNWE